MFSQKSQFCTHLMKLLKLYFYISHLFWLRCYWLLASVVPYPATFPRSDRTLRTSAFSAAVQGWLFLTIPLISAAWIKVWLCWSENGRQTWLSLKAWVVPSTPITTRLWSVRASSLLLSKTPGLPIALEGKYSASFSSMKCHVNDTDLVSWVNRSSRMDLH